MDMRELQRRARQWAIKVFGAPFLMLRERALRVLEESAEVSQSLGVTEEEAVQVIRLAYKRPSGEPKAEIGDLVFCLAILAEEMNLVLSEEAWATLYKNDDPDRIVRIRAKCATSEKIRGSEELAKLCRGF